MLTASRAESRGNVFSPEIAILESRFSNLPEQYGGIDRKYRVTPNGNTFVTFAESNKEQASYGKHLVLLQGGRNPPSGDFYHMIKPLLHEDTVDAITVMYYPLDPRKTAKKNPVIDPISVISDLRHLRDADVVGGQKRLYLGGLSVGADLVALAMKNNVGGNLGVEGVCLLGPASLIAEGVDASMKESMNSKDYVKERLSGPWKFIYEHFSRLEFVFRSAFIAENITQRLAKKVSDLFAKLDFPPNIMHVQDSLKTTFQMVHDMYKWLPTHAVSHKNIPVHAYWAFSELDGIETAEKREPLVKKLQELSADVTVGLVGGRHGGSRVKRNVPSYLNAIRETVE